MSKNKYSKNKNIALVNQVVELSDVLKSGEKNYVVKNYELTKEVDATFHELEGYKEHNKQLLEEVERLRNAMQLFCDRVDKGEVRSTKTYNQFKELLTTH